MAHYDIFRDQLAIRFPGYGHALWEPSPGDPNDVVGVGDVGYINQGKFHRLFNIMLPADHPSHESFGVPDNHEQFRPRVPRHIIPLHVMYHSYSLRPRDPGDSEFTFSCREKPGAVLSLPLEAKREDTRVRDGFGKWMIKHIDQWFAWILERELGIEQMEDIVLVTGTDRTRSWANVAFLGDQTVARVSFRVEATHSRINWDFSPERNTGAVWNWGPSGEVRRRQYSFSIRC
ncbi:hypothetical protein EI94DRAFT_1588721 [Lactarius quietus]|nr:hypothetical protein EI94DRAFT_1588721 [Lactarius quietus]